MPRFKDRNMQRCYEYALDNHTILYRTQGNSGAGHRAAYSEGHRNERCKYQRNWLAYAYYAAGKANRSIPC